MLTKVKTTIAILGLSFLASNAVQAQEFDVQDLSFVLMEKMAKLVEQQLQQQLEQSVLVASGSLIEKQLIVAKSEVVLQTEDAPVTVTVAVNVE